MSNLKKIDEVYPREIDKVFESKVDDSSEFGSDFWVEPSVSREQDAKDPSALFRRDALINGRYLLQRILGRGETSIVWLARDLHGESGSSRRYLAIKVLKESFKDHPNAADVLQTELELTSELLHPNIADTWSVERSGDDCFMTMEYLAGVTLDEAMQRSGAQSFSRDVALELFSYICAGLAYAHSRRIVHADLKPSNIFLTREGQVRILGFSAAGTVDRLADTTGNRKPSEAAKQKNIGSAYTSCETLKGANPDVRNDVYALACITYELFSGSHPFGNKSATEARDQGLVVHAITGLSQKQNKAFQEALAFEPRERTATVEKFYKGLNPPKQRSWVMATAVATAVIVIAALSILSWRASLEDIAVGAFDQSAELIDSTMAPISDYAVSGMEENSDDRIPTEVQSPPSLEQEREQVQLQPTAEESRPAPAVLAATGDGAASVVVANTDAQIRVEVPSPLSPDLEPEQEQVQIQPTVQESQSAPVAVAASVPAIAQSPEIVGSENNQFQKDEQIAIVLSGYNRAIAQPEMSIVKGRRLIEDLEMLDKLGQPVDGGMRQVELKLIGEVRRLYRVEGSWEAISFARQTKLLIDSRELAALEDQLMAERQASVVR